MAKRAGATVVEVKGSHAVYISQPSAVAALIEQAARKVKPAGAKQVPRNYPLELFEMGVLVPDE